MKIAHDDARLSWYGQVSLERTPNTTQAWRIPFERKSLFNGALAQAASTPAGVRIAFHTNTERLALSLATSEVEVSVDLLVNRELFRTVPREGDIPLVWNNLPAGEKLVELWLPTRKSVALSELEIDDGATLTPHNDARPRWVTYGSSITHCGGAHTPSQSWPAIVANAYNLNHTNLGFGGQCHLDIQMAQVIRDLPADVITICAGINIYGHNSLNARTFPAALIGTVELIRERHPKTPIGLISPIFSFDRETEANLVGWSLQQYRESVEAVVNLLRDAGDEHIHYYNGLCLFDESFGHLMPDRLHPNGDGYVKMGENFLSHIAPSLFAPFR